MTETTAFRLQRLASPHRPTAPGRGSRWAAVLLLRVGCAALLAWIGYIHLHLWLEGYRHIPVNAGDCRQRTAREPWSEERR